MARAVAFDNPVHLAAAMGGLIVLSLILGVGIGWLMDRKENR